MLNRLTAEWRELQDSPPGTRFVAHYERHQARDAPYLKAMRFFATVFAAGMAVLLLMVPGPSLPFWLLALVLLPAESRTLAELYDRFELGVRRKYGRGPAEPTAGRADEVTELETAPTQPVSTRPAATPVQPFFAAHRAPADPPQPSAAVTPASQQPRAAAPLVTPPPLASASRPAPAPRNYAAGTIKIWSSDLPVPPPAPRRSEPGAKSTLVVFPPPPERDRDDRSSR